MKSTTTLFLVAAIGLFGSCKGGGGGGGGAPASVGDPGQTSDNAPVAKNDQSTLDEDSVVRIAVLVNDTDPDGDALTITRVTKPEHGTARIDGNRIVYSPDADYFGDDRLEYTITDGSDGEATAEVTIAVRPINDAPVAESDSLSGREDDEILLGSEVLANDSDAEGDSLVIDSVSDPENGHIEWRPGRRGEVPVYIPNPNFIGGELLTYRVRDAEGALSNEAMIRLEVAPTELAFSLDQELGLSAGGGIAIADIDGDRSQDITCVSWDFDRNGPLPSTLETFMNRGAGQFARSSELLSAHHQRVAFAQLDGSGGPELVLFGFGADASFAVPAAYPNRTRQGDSSPSYDFRDPDHFEEPSQERQLVIADFNGDRALDVALAIGSRIKIFLQRSAEFPTGQEIDTGANVSDIVAADLDGDGNTDLAGAYFTADGRYGITVLLNDNGGSGFRFADPQLFSTKSESFHIASGDFNGDGRADLATSGVLDAEVLVWLNRTERPGFLSLSTGESIFQAESHRTWDLEAGDLDRDGFDDLVLARQATADTGSVDVLLSASTQGEPTAFREAHALFGSRPALIRPTDVALGDLDGDGLLDLAVADLDLRGFHRALSRIR
ncbi:MAG: Ig-like domain-containing protein [Planctomycetota bacterium]